MLMQTTKRWFQTATMMAFLAVVALFVSPAFAWDCCCTAEKIAAPRSVSSRDQSNAVQIAQPASQQSVSHSCCAEAVAPVKPVVSIHWAARLEADAPVYSAIEPICECDKHAPAAFALNDRFSSFQTVSLALLPTSYTLFSPVENTRPLVYSGISALPRGPDGRAQSGRGPPTSLSS